MVRDFAVGRARLAMPMAIIGTVPEVVIVLGVALAVVLGIVGNRWWVAHRRPAEDEGLSLGDLVNPVTALAAILLAFIMVEALASYGRARDHIGVEARIVDQYAETAGRLADVSASRGLQGDLICYVRAVRFKEWPTMARGERAAEVGVWTGRFEASLAGLRRAGGDAELERLIDLDAERGQARLARIAESTPSIPAGLNGLMFGSVVLSVFGLALFTRPGGSRALHATMVVAFAVVVGATLYMINDLDQPFAGFNRLEPTEIARIQDSMESDFAARYPSVPIPCDAFGTTPTS